MGHMISSPPFRSHASPTIVPEHLFESPVDLPRPRSALPAPIPYATLLAGAGAFVLGMLLAAVVVGATLWMTNDASVVADAPLGVFSLER